MPFQYLKHNYLCKFLVKRGSWITPQSQVQFKYSSQKQIKVELIFNLKQERRFYKKWKGALGWKNWMKRRRKEKIKKGFFWPNNLEVEFPFMFERIWGGGLIFWHSLKCLFLNSSFFLSWLNVSKSPFSNKGSNF